MEQDVALAIAPQPLCADIGGTDQESNALREAEDVDFAMQIRSPRYKDGQAPARCPLRFREGGKGGWLGNSLVQAHRDRGVSAPGNLTNIRQHRIDTSLRGEGHHRVQCLGGSCEFPKHALNSIRARVVHEFEASSHLVSGYPRAYCTLAV